MENQFVRIVKRFKDSPHKVLFIILSRIICKIRSIYYSLYIDSGDGKIIISDPFLRFSIVKQKNSKLIIKGKLRIKSHMGGKNPVYLELGKDSIFQINGDFIIGQGVRIFLHTASELIIGGRSKESDSGITSDTLIMVYKNIKIGKDFLCAWNIFITDSDWHQIVGQQHYADVIIGDHVWIANSCNILKGTIIGNNCIVASNTKIHNKHFTDNVLLGGAPPKILKNDVDWVRDIN